MDQKNPTISVIINCLNGSEYLTEAIDSVFAQTYQDWEIIFFDDASTDNSLEIARNYGSKVICIASVTTYPLGQARNLAIKHARGKYLAFLDCDDIWLPEKLEKQVEAFDKDQHIGLVFPNVTYFNKKGDMFQLFDQKKPPEGNVFGELLQKNFLCISSVAIKKEALSGLNEWFDERFSCVEDWDLFLRIAHDWKLGYVDSVLARYRMHEKSWTHKYKAEFPEEGEIMIKKLLKLYPNVQEEYGSQLKILRARMSYQRFALLWGLNRRKEARNLIKPFLLADKKFLLPYIASYFFTFSWYVFFLKICRIKTYSL